jgi:hypothetical protein
MSKSANRKELSNTKTTRKSQPVRTQNIFDIFGKKSEKRIEQSFAPSINQHLVPFLSGKREDLGECNTERALRDLKVPLEIRTKENTCEKYTTENAKKILLANLSANKHVDVEKVLMPKQNLGNCWFNVMFAMLFISDKGRKFFHFFRELMIQGKQTDGHVIPAKLQNVFALLNFAIECALTGNPLVRKIDTNVVIKQIYDAIARENKSYVEVSTSSSSLATKSKSKSKASHKYKKKRSGGSFEKRNLINENDAFTMIPDFFNAILSKYHYIPKVHEAWNPLYYYLGIINYLGNKSVSMLLVMNLQPDPHSHSPADSWNARIEKEIHHQMPNKLPAIIVVEIFDGVEKSAGNAGEIHHRPRTITLRENIQYTLDSVAIRDIRQEHFCALLTCEKKEMAFDGYSSHQLLAFDWKNKINSAEQWGFPEVHASFQKMKEVTTLKWSFMHGYQMLMYYRTSDSF